MSVSPRAPTAMCWVGPLSGHSGYAEEGRATLIGLRELDIPVYSIDLAEPTKFHDLQRIVPEQDVLLARAAEELDLGPDAVYIYHRYWAASPIRVPGVHIWRTMFETTSLPAEWEFVVGEYDEIWVPSEFNFQTFRSSRAVRADRLRVVGCPVPDWVSQGNLGAAAREARARQNVYFVSVLKWRYRKGWDQLLRAFEDEFGESDSASLVIKVNPFGPVGSSPMGRALDWYGRNTSRRAIPDNVKIVEESYSVREMLELYGRSDVFVLPSRGEGWGRPYMEAMLLGIPVIGPDWGGSRAFMNHENSYLASVRVREVAPREVEEWPYFRGGSWADCELDSLREQMRLAYDEVRSGHPRVADREQLQERYSARAIASEMRSALLPL